MRKLTMEDIEKYATFAEKKALYCEEKDLTIDDVPDNEEDVIKYLKSKLTYWDIRYSKLYPGFIKKYPKNKNIKEIILFFLFFAQGEEKMIRSGEFKIFSNGRID